MARGVNKVILVGHLGNDPDTKYTQSGMAITSISLATTSYLKDKDGNQTEKAEWHRVKLFGKLGEIAGEYLRKGSQCYIEGRISYGKYTDGDGIERYTTDIVANEMQMLGSREGGGQQREEHQNGGRGPSQSSARQSSAPARRQAPAQQAPMDDFADDDIPF